MYDLLFFFFFSSRRRHTRFDCDWSSDVCSSDLLEELAFGVTAPAERPPPGFASPDAAVTAMPAWNASRVMAAALQNPGLFGPGVKPAAPALSPPPLAGGGRPRGGRAAPHPAALADPQHPPRAP